MLSKSLDCPPNVGGRAQGAEGVSVEAEHTTSPLRGERPSALLCADKPAVVATDAIIPHRPPTLGGEFCHRQPIYELL